MIRTYAGWAVTALVALLLIAALWPSPAGSPEEKQALAEGRTIIVYWDRHSGHEHEMRNVLFDEFNASQDEIYVRSVPIGYNVSMEKLLTSISGGDPPDFCSLDTTIMAQLAAQGCLTDLSDFMAGHPNMQQDQFFPHAWKLVAFDGGVWGAPATIDVYCLLWSKAAFRQAGLDPNRPPQNIDELMQYAGMLTKRTGNNVDQVGFLPWLPWDLTMMWGELFGGKWYDEETGRAVCADDPNLIRMFEWQLSFTLDPNATDQAPYAVDPTRFMLLTQMGGSYASATNPFYTGKVAMITEGEWQTTFIKKFAPTLDWGVAPLPQPDGVRPLAHSPTAHVDVVPVGCRHPKEVLTFLSWFHAKRGPNNTSPATDYCFAIHNIPPRRDEATEPRFMDDPKFSLFVKELLNKEVIYDPSFAQIQYMLDEIARYRELVITRAISPAEATRAIQANVNAEIDRQAEMWGQQDLSGVEQP